MEPGKVRFVREVDLRDPDYPEASAPVVFHQKVSPVIVGVPVLSTVYRLPLLALPCRGLLRVSRQ